MSWQVRLPVVADAERIAEINVRGWQHAYAGLMPAQLLDALQIAPRAERLVERFSSGTGAAGYVVVDERDAAAGYCWFGSYRPDDDVPDGPGDPDPTWGEIYALYVDPAVIGTGAGGTLMRAALTDLAPRPVALWVLEQNARARGFYARFGFLPDGARADFDAGGTPVPEIRLRLGHPYPLV